MLTSYRIHKNTF